MTPILFYGRITDHPNLSKLAFNTITNGENNIYVSAASGWEISIKTKLGKILIQTEDLSSYIKDNLDKNRFLPLEISFDHVLRVYSFPLHHNDPFDRLLIAQSHFERMPIITKDPFFKLYDISIIW